MNIRSFLCLVLLSLIATGNVQAKKKPKKKAVNYFVLIEAYAQQVQPGTPGPPQTGSHFIITWTCADQPGPFFWRGMSGWLSCSMVRAHKTVNRKNIRAGFKEYETEPVSPGEVREGDTLELSPVTGGRFPVPAEIPADARNTLFYKTAGNGWRAFPVKNIEKKPCVARP